MGAMGDGGGFAGVDGRPTKLQLLTACALIGCRYSSLQCARHPDLPVFEYRTARCKQ